MKIAGDKFRNRTVEDGALSPWSGSAAKRFFDISLAAAGLIVSSPAMAATAMAVKFSSPGPILFRQMRTGMHGRSFQIYKFRTMRLHPAGSGPSVTTANDERLTAMGKLLRKTKLDEFPQLLNILRGDMSFVGPRPKVPHHQTYMLQVRPGITGPASLAFRHEEHMLHGIPSSELDNVQVNVLMPRKRELDESYIRTATFFSDLLLIFRTACRLVPAKHGEKAIQTEDFDSFRRSLGALSTRLQETSYRSPQNDAVEEELRVA